MNWQLEQNMRGYNKLVRDKIPHIIESHGKEVDYSKIDLKHPHLVFEYLVRKLNEEVEELRAAMANSYVDGMFVKSVDEECADVAEVLNAISSHFGENDWRTVMEVKYNEKGGFDDLTVLFGVSDD